MLGTLTLVFSLLAAYLLGKPSPHKTGIRVFLLSDASAFVPVTSKAEALLLLQIRVVPK